MRHSGVLAYFFFPDLADPHRRSSLTLPSLPPDVIKLQLVEAGLVECLLEVVAKTVDGEREEDVAQLKTASDLMVLLLLGGKTPSSPSGTCQTPCVVLIPPVIPQCNGDDVYFGLLWTALSFKNALILFLKHTARCRRPYSYMRRPSCDAHICPFPRISD